MSVSDSSKVAPATLPSAPEANNSAILPPTQKRHKHHMILHSKNSGHAVQNAGVETKAPKENHTSSESVKPEIKPAVFAATYGASGSKSEYGKDLEANVNSKDFKTKITKNGQTNISYVDKNYGTKCLSTYDKDGNKLTQFYFYTNGNKMVVDGKTGEKHYYINGQLTRVDKAGKTSWYNQ